MRPVINLRLPKKQKSKIKKKLNKKSVEGIKKNELFTENFSIFYCFLKAMGFLFFVNIIFLKNQQMLTNTLEPRNFRENTFYQRH